MSDIQGYITRKQFDKCVEWYMSQGKHPDKCLVGDVPILCAILLIGNLSEDQKVKRFAFVKLLLQHKANPNIEFVNRNYYERTRPLHVLLADHRCDVELAQLLFNHGGKLNGTYCTPYGKKGYINVAVKCLCHHTHYWNTNTPRVVYLLMKHGANPKESFNKELMKTWNSFTHNYEATASGYFKDHTYVRYFKDEEVRANRGCITMPCWYIIRGSPENAYQYVYNTPSGQILQLNPRTHVTINDEQKGILKIKYLLDRNRLFHDHEKKVTDAEYARIDGLATKFLKDNSSKYEGIKNAYLAEQKRIEQEKIRIQKEKELQIQREKQRRQEIQKQQELKRKKLEEERIAREQELARQKEEELRITKEREIASKKEENNKLAGLKLMWIAGQMSYYTQFSNDLPNEEKINLIQSIQDALRKVKELVNDEVYEKIMAGYPTEYKKIFF